MYRASRFVLAALSVLTTDGRARADAASTRAVTAGRAGACRRARAGRPAPKRPAACSQPARHRSDIRRPLDEHRRRPGAVSALPGHPRAASCSTSVRFAARHRRTGCSSSAPTTSAGATSATPAPTSGRAVLVTGLWDQIPQFYSIDTQNAVYAHRRRADSALDDATQLAIQNGQANLERLRPAGHAVRPARTPGHRPPRRTRDADHGIDLTARSRPRGIRGELPWGASFGFSNDVEVALPYDSRTNDFSLGAEWIQRPRDGARRLRRLVVRQPRRHAGVGQPAAADDTTSAPGRGPMALWPSNSAQTVSVAGYAKFARRTQAHRLRLLRRPQQQRAAAAVHHQPGAAAVGAAAGARPTARPRSSPPTSASCRVRRRTGGSARGCGATTTTTRRRRPDIPQFINYDTSVTDVLDRRPRAVRARPDRLRRRRHLDRAPAAGAHRRLYAHNSHATTSASSRARGEHVSPQGRRRRLAVGDLPRALRPRAIEPAPASTRRC